MAETNKKLSTNKKIALLVVVCLSFFLILSGSLLGVSGKEQDKTFIAKTISSSSGKTEQYGFQTISAKGEIEVCVYLNNATIHGVYLRDGVRIYGTTSAGDFYVNGKNYTLKYRYKLNPKTNYQLVFNSNASLIEMLIEM